MKIDKAFRLIQSQAALERCSIKKRRENRGNDFSSPGILYQNTTLKINIKYIDNRKISKEDCVNKNLYSPTSRVLPHYREFDSPIKCHKLLDMCYQRVELM